jgi:hypothetical protein
MDILNSSSLGNLLRTLNRMSHAKMPTDTVDQTLGGQFYSLFAGADSTTFDSNGSACGLQFRRRPPLAAQSYADTVKPQNRNGRVSMVELACQEST